MVRLNKVYGNLMVDLLPTNAKLRRRALQLTVRASGADGATARATLDACDGQVKTAVVCLLAGVGVDDARARLARAQGSVRGALQARP
jgi:N-acetylmuramic acid 6-phosphate etherase